MYWLNSLVNTSNTQLNSTMNEKNGDTDNNIDENAAHSCAGGNCNENDCAGIKLSCSWCQKSTYLSCLIDNDDFKYLVNAITKKSMDSIVTLPLSSTIGTRVKDAFQTIFQPKINIDFVCYECKSTGSFKDIVDKQNERTNEAKAKADAAAGNIVMLKQKHATEISTLTQQLIEANAKIDELNNGANVQQNACENFIEKKASIDTLLTEMISASKIHTKHLEQLSSALNDIMSSSHDQNKSNENMAHSDARRASIESHLQFPKMNGASSLSQEAEVRTSQNASSLQPPVRKSNDDNTSSSSDNAQAIYVSKFRPNTSCEDIASHIIGKTNLTSNDFTVKLMAGRRILDSKFLSFVSFRISPTSDIVRSQILNNNLWAPDFKAVPFIQKSSRISDKNDSESHKQNRQKLTPPSNASKKSDQNQRNDCSGIVNERKSATKGVNNKQASNKQQKRDPKSKPKTPTYNQNQTGGHHFPGFCCAQHQYQFSPHLCLPQTHHPQQFYPIYQQPQQQQQPWYHQPQQQQQHFGQNQVNANTQQQPVQQQQQHFQQMQQQNRQ